MQEPPANRPKDIELDAFKENIFINCPFDKEYEPMLRAIIFTCLYSRLVPKVSDYYDAGKGRLEHIIGLIKSSKYSIHDISRMNTAPSDKLPRFNMPFELGLDIGIKECAFFQSDSTRKFSLVIDESPYRYKEAMSDLGGSDIKSYGKDNPTEKLIKELRNWFAGLDVIPRGILFGNRIWSEFNEFTSDYERGLKEKGIGKDSFLEVPVNDYIDFVERWIPTRKLYKKAYEVKDVEG